MHKSCLGLILIILSCTTGGDLHCTEWLITSYNFNMSVFHSLTLIDTKTNSALNTTVRAFSVPLYRIFIPAYKSINNYQKI